MAQLKKLALGIIFCCIVLAGISGYLGMREGAHKETDTQWMGGQLDKWAYSGPQDSNNGKLKIWLAGSSVGLELPKAFSGQEIEALQLKQGQRAEIQLLKTEVEKLQGADTLQISGSKIDGKTLSTWDDWQRTKNRAQSVYWIVALLFLATAAIIAVKKLQTQPVAQKAQTPSHVRQLLLAGLALVITAGVFYKKSLAPLKTPKDFESIKAALTGWEGFKRGKETSHRLRLKLYGYEIPFEPEQTFSETQLASLNLTVGSNVEAWALREEMQTPYSGFFENDPRITVAVLSANGQLLLTWQQYEVYSRNSQKNKRVLSYIFGSSGAICLLLALFLRKTRKQ